MNRLMQFVRSSWETSDSNSIENRSEERQREVVEEGSRRTMNGDATSVTVELDALNCPVCWEPMRPPIFQCAVGHLICSSCLGKLPKTNKCHYCSRKGDYNRCYGIENILASIQVPCSNAKYGCTVKTSNYQKEDHAVICPHTRCFCPNFGCVFTGSTGLLLGHLVTEHGWPCTKFRYGWSFLTDVKEGVHVLSGEDGQLFLLNIVLGLVGCFVIICISVFCVQPHDTEPKFWCVVTFNYRENSSFHHVQCLDFQVPSTTLSNGIPYDPRSVRVPKSYLEKENKILVTVNKALY